MKLVFWCHWSIRSRLLAMALLPVAYMFATLVWYAWQARLSEVRDELAERGPLIARVLADSSEFSLVAGRHEDLRLTINGVLQADPNIYRIEVLNGQRRLLVQVQARSGQPDVRSYEAPVQKRLMWVNMLAPDGTPYFGGREQRSGMTVETMGYVRVTMSPAALQHKQNQRFYIELLVASAGLLVCAVLAWQLARGLNASVQASMQALREADDDKRRLIRKVNTAVEDERKSIALEIHDELNAALIGARLEAQRIADLTAPTAPLSTAAREEIRSKAQSIIQLTLGLYNSGRTLVRRLRPEVLDMLGLDGAVEEVVRHYASAHRGCQFSFSAEGAFRQLESGVGISAYRIVQEALANVVKHARASEVAVQLALDDAGLHLRIEDNGIGFDAALASSGIGLVGMRERVYAFNGRIDIDTGLTAGTRIHILLPV
ncbi:MAG: sensor histidine kinase [Sphingomonadaceae bacterium]